MKKHADRYLSIDPWIVEETSYDPRYALVSESIFSLGNEYMGVRGYFEEGTQGESLQGSYVNGIYERRTGVKSGYRGMVAETEFMVNTVDWLSLRLFCGDLAFDHAVCPVEEYSRTLNLHTGLLRRDFTWSPEAGVRLRICFERFLSMTRPELGGARMMITALEGAPNLRWEAGLDFSRPHRSAAANLWDCRIVAAEPHACAIEGTTVTTKQRLRAMASFRYDSQTVTEPFSAEKFTGTRFFRTLNEGETLTFTRIAALERLRRDEDDLAFEQRCQRWSEELPTLSYTELLEESAGWWRRQWELSDIRIDGDEMNQQGIRYCIFQLHQVLHTARYGAVIGAKGLTGEVYNGNTFWDTEVYCLPFFVFNNPSAAKSILRFRYETLPQAMERARALDCKGAFYPIATISGTECCDLWQHASLQLQASTGVMYGLQTYVAVTGDRDFLYAEGAEMLVEICRMLATRGDWSPTTGKYGFYGVMGPDEFQMMANNNAYTNLMAEKTFRYTLEVLEELRQERPARYAALCEKHRLVPGELVDWQRMADHMERNEDPDTLLFEQQDGFFSLPHLDISSIPVEEFPLYEHWSYERIYRNDMLKQPDVLMFLLLYNSEFSREQIAANYEYYEPRCIHESSLSPSVHSILAQQLGRYEDADRFFSFSTRMDLDNYNRNTGDGLHITSIAGAWMNVVYGFGGLRSDGGSLRLHPTLPRGWKSYAFRLLWRESVVEISVDPEGASLRVVQGGSASVILYDEEIKVDGTPIKRPLPKEVAICSGF